MVWSLNEILFYGGLIFMALSALAGLVFILISRISLMRLNARFDEEYGKIKSKT